MTSVVDTFRKALGIATSGIGQVERGIAEIRTRLEALDHEEQKLLSLPAPRGEVVATLERLVRELGDQYLARHGPELIRAASGRVDRAIGPPETRPPDVLQPGMWPDGMIGSPISFEQFAAFNPDGLLKGLRRMVEVTAYESGPPRAELLPRLAAIQGERGGLEHVYAQIVDEANGAGIPMEHLPGERGRRIQAAQRREAWELDGRVNAELYRRRPELRRPPPDPA